MGQLLDIDFVRMECSLKVILTFASSWTTGGSVEQHLSDLCSQAGRYICITSSPIALYVQRPLNQSIEDFNNAFVTTLLKYAPPLTPLTCYRCARISCAPAPQLNSTMLAQMAVAGNSRPIACDVLHQTLSVLHITHVTACYYGMKWPVHTGDELLSHTPLYKLYQCLIPDTHPEFDLGATIPHRSGEFYLFHRDPDIQVGTSKAVAFAWYGF